MNRSTTRLLRSAAACCALLLVVGACSNSDNSTKGSKTHSSGTTGAETAGLFPPSVVNKAVHTGTPKRGGTLTFGLESDVLDVSPNQKPIQPADVQMANAVFDPLISFGNTGKFKGVAVTDNTDHAYNQLADSISSKNDDLTHWTMKLRSGVEFSDGTPLTAQEVVDHTKWIMASPTCSCAADAEDIASVSASGPLTVEYTLKKPLVDFPTKLTGGGLAWIIEPKAREAAPDPSNPDIKHLIGTGPFKYQSKSGDSYTLVANTHYYGVDHDNHDAKLPYLDKIIFEPLSDSVTRLQAVQSGGVQIMQTADTSNLVGAKKDPKLKVQPSEGTSSTILILNLTHPPFGVTPKPGESPQDTAKRSLDDPTALAARQAFNYSINRNEINQKYYKGSRVPAYGQFPTNSPWYSASGQLPRYDEAKAKSLVKKVEAAGVKMRVHSLCINTPESSGVNQIITQQGKLVGIDESLKQVQQAILVQSLLGGTGDIPWDSTCFRDGQLADPDGIYNGLHTAGPANISKYSRANVDNWLDEARESANEADRKKLYDKIEAQVAKDVVIIPLLFDYYGNVFNDDVSGLTTPSPSSLGIIRPGNLYRKR